ncbi:MAG: Gfo/Idh/MocA family oxidoreductase [Acidobacteriota bacterium]|nr:Gfo/Idh/MocA family oxidoreductase [Acidobacteriota bacterium]
MENNNNSRRNFLKLATVGAAGISFGSRASSYAGILGTNDRVRVGIVGFSDRTRDALIPALMKNAAAQNFEIVAVSDIWSLRRDEGAEHIGKLTGKTIAKARNNDELYERKDVDAVIVATADFQHALHALEAVRAGRDVYVEKPLANTMSDARALLKGVKETNKVVQVGTQRRSSPGTIRVRDYIQSGAFGDINMVRFSSTVNQPARWRRPKLVAALRQEDTDWSRFLMNRTKDAWDPRKYVEFRLFWPYSSGIPDQWMVHQIDALHMITGLARPRSVVAGGGIYQWHDGRINPDTVTAVFDYGPLNDPAKGFQVIFTGQMGNSAEGNNDTFYSNGGTLDATKGRVTPSGGLTEKAATAMDMKPNLLAEMKLAEKSRSGEMADTATGADDAVSAHMRNWMECIRSRKAPNADVTTGYNHSIALCMTIAALHTGRRAVFDETKQEVQVTTEPR